MKKIPRKLLLLALLALAGGLGLWLLRERAQNPWQPLPKGGAVRLHAITYGAKNEIHYGFAPLAERVAATVKTRSWRPLFSADVGAGVGAGNNGFVVWLLARERPFAQGITMKEKILHLPDGQILRSDYAGGSSNARGLVVNGAIFDVVPYRARTLRFVAMIDGQRFEFETVNPAWRTNLPVWKSEPLPQMHENGGITLALRGLKIETSEQKATNWIPIPEWAVTKGGAKADEWFDVKTSYEDAGGNVSQFMALFAEPVWKIRATVMRSRYYPFSEAEDRAPLEFEFFVRPPAIPEPNPPPAKP